MTGIEPVSGSYKSVVADHATTDFKANTNEIEVLEMLAGKRGGRWGAWVSACLKSLAEAGLCTRGPHFRITDAGRVVLSRAEPQSEGGE